MKTKFLKLTAIMLLVAGGFCSCTNAIDLKYDIYENHEISACGINDPLQNIEWLKNYCDSIKETQTISSVTIELYKIINTDEHVFRAGFSYPNFDDSPFPYSEYWKNCTGELIFVIHSGIPPNPESVENFMKDKEYIAELFHFVKQ